MILRKCIMVPHISRVCTLCSDLLACSCKYCWTQMQTEDLTLSTNQTSNIWVQLRPLTSKDLDEDLGFVGLKGSWQFACLSPKSILKPNQAYYTVCACHVMKVNLLPRNFILPHYNKGFLYITVHLNLLPRFVYPWSQAPNTVLSAGVSR